MSDSLQPFSKPPQSARQWAMFCHLSAFAGLMFPFGNLLGPLIIWQLKKDSDPFIDAQGKEALNFQITVAIAATVSMLLVLLIIFMVAAPLATVDIKVDLPASTATPQPRPEKPIFLSVKTDKSLYLGEEKVAREQIGQVLDARTKGKKDTTIFFQADKGVDYGDLMEVMNTLRGAGYLKVGLVGLQTAGKK
ncbi:TonB system transport protein ExbD [Pseudomonas savastanoi]|uniref:TonB system transport protein ExbD n=1 Tax=Pseudomonas savastanoi TaxID=29438 RepID=UPI000F002FED|nr:TonB system transport protein ExbD [Pseudomonas savastanoi]RMU25932.1 TonB system transport protein ExbD1 [Pseudomonas savastanoi pv. glycinea]